jgi:hypothetical protein
MSSPLPLVIINELGMPGAAGREHTEQTRKIAPARRQFEGETAVQGE